ncbi:MAG: hypothetical protein EON89_06310 [Brevundimonas sp.]|nr:MAG: hypothetical protein EON89_06310 [Brevundimonas sp.]
MKTTIFVSAAAIAVLALGACNRETPAAESATDMGVDATATTDGGMAPADASGGGSTSGGSTSTGGSSGSSSGAMAPSSGSGGSMSGAGSAPAVDTGGMPQGSTATAPRSSAVNEQVPGGPVAPGTPVSPPRGGVTQGPRDPATGR